MQFQSGNMESNNDDKVKKLEKEINDLKSQVKHLQKVVDNLLENGKSNKNSQTGDSD